MYALRCRWLLCLALLPAMITAAESPKLGSTVFKFEDLAVKSTPVGERRDVADQPTATFEKFECHISTLNPGQVSHPPHTHPQEELIILRDGSLDVNVNGEIQHVGPGSMFFFASNQPHAVQNNGKTPATYFVFNFATAATRSAPAIGAPVAAGHLGSTVWEWSKLAVKPTPKGARRDVVDSPTATLVNFESHLTTINPGEMPHAAHRHPDEEIILVKEGELDVTINGRTQHAGAGSIFFYGSNDEHGMKNTGTIPATYYVIRIVTDVSAALAKK